MELVIRNARLAEPRLAHGCRHRQWDVGIGFHVFQDARFRACPRAVQPPRERR